MKLLAAVAVALVLMTRTTMVGADAAAIDPRALILLRVLAYDRNLAARSGDQVVIAVVESADDRGLACATPMVDALTVAARKIVIGQRPIRGARIRLEPGVSLRARLGELHAAAVYVCVGAGAVAEVARATRAAGALSFTGAEPGPGGLAIGMVRGADKVELWVNLEAARAERADLSAALLRLAKVVKR